jgi:DNA polymerase III sliding clamp (beta) subunit (PCNA family)
MLGADERYAQVSVPGPELASGIRQVQHAVDRAHGGTGRVGELSGDGERSEPVGVDLGGVQVEIDADEVRLVATDRHRLALRSLRGQRFEGGAAGVGVAADELLRLVPALLLADMVVLRVDHSGLTCLIHDQPHVLDGRPDGFPDYRVVLDGIPPAEARLVADRGAALTALVADGPDGVVLLTATGHGLAVIGRPRAGDVRAVVGTWRGPRFQVAFDAAHLEEALAVSVGPDVIIELANGPRPAVVRSADHGAFTTLIMPRAQPGHVPEPARTSRLG